MSYQWALLEKIIIVLATFEELTRQISSSSSSAAEVIPSVTVLKRLLARENEGDTGIKTMKTTLLEAAQKRFKNIENEPLYAVATLLDPRFKDRYFTGADSNKHAKDALTQDVEKMVAALLSRTRPEGAETVPEKAPRLEAQPDSSSSRKSSLKGLFEEILQEHDEERGASSTQVQNQIQTYWTEQTVPRSDSPFQYWGVNQIRFPTLAATAAKFLCAPCTSVDSERLFSVASNIIDARRNRLGGERAAMLIFLKKNLPFLLKL
ncbi:Zinc finger BED domain-containing protein 4 [Anabarilius grahami]|uniref:Zinc finger BED domain-containing protein 4 n=1 Tax=Anabarilius grahami TaxID=495550 RepID=A0A3N0YX67_ANAGA|nr:Zinc finger BED domain-containing protein 4 [Anabarilius grahami]